MIKLLWLAIAAAVATITLKTTAWLLTDSVGLLSDAAESVVNLVAAVVAMLAMRWALKPADEEHAYGHQKAEYFAAGVEGAMIVVAAVLIGATALPRLFDPQPIEAAGLGVAISTVASLINLAVGALLLREGRRLRSIILEADGKHLLTDVWTSVGVLGAVVLVALTGWNILDPLIALAVAVNIIGTGLRLVLRSIGGLMDRGLDAAEQAQIAAVLTRFENDGISYHALRTRQAGSRAFVSLHVLVPGAWTVQRGHDVAEEIEDALRTALPHATVFTHLEPAEDPRSFADVELDRLDLPQRGVELGAGVPFQQP
ncbi:cation diffusion facilitator family transporter [Solirubrobacter taibaiensis]|nr:cation diffusion facilitator family transporter [Solirubrobacter taibaiensis]